MDFTKDGVKTVVRNLARRSSTFINRRLINPGPSVMDEDWDTLLILDGCRADTFAGHMHELEVDGEYHRRVSPASSSMEFMEETFEDKEFHDTVYVTANPHIEYFDSGIFHDVFSLLSDEHWNSNLDTVLPETVAQKGIEARQKYPNKRLILHFMQPHYPFIGEKGQSLPHRGYNKSLKHGHHDQPSIWDLLRDGSSCLDISVVQEAYEENLSIVLDTINHILPNFNRETVVITADHGNFIGERLWPIPLREYGHPGTAFAPETAYVPWFEISGDDRPEIRPDPPVRSNQPKSEDLVNQRLESLGYKE
ncbi:hypothetical protein GRX01_05365 [Halobaculum sp. WSA2]|uniref:Sulfatase n=1 Tax=Halobaculum saliterrae TaxID=2073113 RepID=A0A6B0SWY4_9EURY|nr:hypothetical protein [Halobaculum saliterrae]MXR40772.1 hypothetical protein [Halobaculum saliterrae]